MAHLPMTLFTAAGLVVALFIPAQAQNCSLKVIASLNVEADDNGVRVPVKIDGKDEMLRLNFDETPVGLYQSYVAEKKFEIHPNEGGKTAMRIATPTTATSTISEFQIGTAKQQNMAFQVLPGAPPKGVVGELGMAALSDYDVEIDIAGRRVNLFSQDHCPGTVVYWTKEKAERLPIHRLGDERNPRHTQDC